MKNKRYVMKVSFLIHLVKRAIQIQNCMKKLQLINYSKTAKFVNGI